MSYPFQAKATPLITANEQLNAVRAFFGQILRDELREYLPQIAPSAPTVPLSRIGGLELAQEVTGLSKPRLYALVSERSIPHKKKGNRLFFDREELVAWIGEGNRAVRKNGR